MHQLLPYLLTSLLVVGLATPLLEKKLKYLTGVFLSIIPLSFFLYFLWVFTSLSHTESLLIPSIMELVRGGGVSVRLDGLSVLFGLMVSGIGVLVLLYASAYMRKYLRQGYFFMLLTFFMGAMLGMVLANNLIALFIFWELTSVFSFLLIGFDNHLEKARKAALQGFLITAFGGLCLLFGVLLIGDIAGTYEISELLNKGELITSHPRYPLIFIFLVLAIFTKSAQFPFHFWLPGAMNAPTPVSAYLHSATMVNAGVFLLLRVNPFIGDTLLWDSVLPLFGSITMFTGALLAFGEKDLKRILAFTTISALGMMVLLAGIDTTKSIKAALVFFVVHGLYKGALFMIAGLIDKTTGTRDIDRLGQLWKPLGLVSFAALLSFFSMAGLPPMLGFIGKELIYGAKMQAVYFSNIILVLGLLSNMLMVGVSFYVFYQVFWPYRRVKEKVAIDDHYARSFLLSFGPVILAAFSLGLGLAPVRIGKYLQNAIYFIRAEEVAVDLALWHGVNVVLILSIITVGGGILLFILRKQVVCMVARFNNWLNKFYLPDVFDKGIKNYVKVASRQTDRIQHGYHRYYLITFFVITSLLVVVHLFANSGIAPELQLQPIKSYLLILFIIMAFAAVYAIFSSSRIAAILALGIVGYGIGLVYLFFGAVDLAITQFLVETLVMVIFVLVIYRLPVFAVLSNKVSRVRDIIIALLAGGMMGMVVLKSNFFNVETPISDYFINNSLNLAHGKNIVNVILVDFRALDTLGEITVLALAGAGVVALLRMNGKKERMNNIVLRIIVNLVSRLLFYMSIYLLWRGHNAPGGGFIGGIIAAIGFVFYAIIHGPGKTRERIKLPPMYFIGGGLLISAFTTVISVFTGRQPLTGLWINIPLPVIGDLHLGTPFLFDIGVYLVVFGMITSIIINIMEVLRWN